MERSRARWFRQGHLHFGDGSGGWMWTISWVHKSVGSRVRARAWCEFLGLRNSCFASSSFCFSVSDSGSLQSAWVEAQDSVSVLSRAAFIQFSSVQSLSCVRLCDPMNRSTSGLLVHHQLPEFTQTHVHRVGDAIQPSHPLSSPSPPAPNPSQHQSLFQWVNSSHEVAKVLEFQL